MSGAGPGWTLLPQAVLAPVQWAPQGPGRTCSCAASPCSLQVLSIAQDITVPLPRTRLPASPSAHALSCCLARELTKRHEEFWRGSLQGAVAEFAERGPRGEFVLLVEGAGEEVAAGGAAGGPVGEEQILAALREAVAAGESPSSAAKAVAVQLGQSRKLCYRLSLALAEGQEA